LTLRQGESLWLDAVDLAVKVASLDGPAQLFLVTDGPDGADS
jgi:hypothetical protein